MGKPCPCCGMNNARHRPIEANVHMRKIAEAGKNGRFDGLYGISYRVSPLTCPRCDSDWMSVGWEMHENSKDVHDRILVHGCYSCGHKYTNMMVGHPEYDHMTFPPEGERGDFPWVFAEKVMNPSEEGE